MKNLILLLIILPCFMHGQESGIAGKLVTNFKGFEIGYSYPYLTLNNSFSLVQSHYNGGVKGGVTWGRQYGSGIAVAFTPSASLCYIDKMVFKPNHSTKTTSVLYRNFSIYVPVSIEFPFFFNGRVRGNVFVSMPLESSGWINGHETKLSLLQAFNKEDFTSPDKPWLRSGFMVQFLVPIVLRHDHHNFLSFEFMYFAVYNHQTNTRERWATMSYIRRNLSVKEKRDKWDRYLMKKQSN